MRRLRNERGQVLLLTAGLLLVMLLFSGLVVDVGAWYRTQRQLQSAVDAAALAAAQDLPTTTSATATANDYPGTNLANAGFANTTPCTGGADPSCTITFPASPAPCAVGACVDVVASQQANGVLARLASSAFSTVLVKAHARALVSAPQLLGRVAPVAVPYNPAVECVPASANYPDCFGSAAGNWRTLNVSSEITSSGSAVLNLACHADAPQPCKNTSASELGGWIVDGYGDLLPANGWYGAVTGQQVGGLGSQGFSKLDRDEVLFFPVYDQCSDSAKHPVPACQKGPDAYHVIGFSAFAIDSYTWNGNTQRLTGYFVTFIASGEIASGTGGIDFGIHVVNLVQ